jgi:ATP-binding cassette subfamily G (WHITE) protein 2 (PDR)
MLEMGEFAEAIVGISGEGLNVEQRKRLSIGVELAAKPAVLLFLDEPTSGLDSQSSWAIVQLLRKLANNGQAVLATIHQPSSMLFEQFDRLLFLAKGGRTVYFGDLGPNSRSVVNYFSKNGARLCGESENPAEYIMGIVAAGSVGESKVDWPKIWNTSDESRSVKAEQERIEQKMANFTTKPENQDNRGKFAASLSTQIWYTTIRVFQQYWRTPSYIWGKFMLGTTAAL